MSKKGMRYEGKLVNEIYDITDGEMIPVPVGYSGNHRLPAPDILLNDGLHNHGFEVKRTSKEKKTFETEEFEQLLEFSTNYGGPTYVYVGVRFNHRRLIIVKLYVSPDSTVEDVVESGHKMCPVESKVTRADNLIVYKPDSDDWPGAGESDGEYLLDTIGYYDTARVRPTDVV